jgi:hypothetical protein
MLNLDIPFFRNIIIVFLFSILFGTAGLDKFKTLQTPEWFIKQFDRSFLSRFPRLLAFSYWKIAAFETLLAIAFVSSLFVPGILPLALLGGMLLFGFLCFGLRMIGDYQGSANIFIYFTASLVALYVIG